jgi:DNA-binding response OmpR family regulator
MIDHAIGQQHAPAGAVSQSTADPNCRILVVEDDGDIRRLNFEVLDRAGYRVEAVEDGDVAWDKLRAKPFDLIVTDNEMPNLSGVVLITMMHAHGCALPVIMATAKMPSAEFERQPWLRPAAALLKPYTVDELLGTVKSVLSAIDGTRLQAPPPRRWHEPTSADCWQF